MFLRTVKIIKNKRLRNHYGQKETKDTHQLKVMWNAGLDCRREKAIRQKTKKIWENYALQLIKKKKECEDHNFRQ